MHFSRPCRLLQCSQSLNFLPVLLYLLYCLLLPQAKPKAEAETIDVLPAEPVVEVSEVKSPEMPVLAKKRKVSYCCSLIQLGAHTVWVQVAIGSRCLLACVCNSYRHLRPHRSGVHACATIESCCRAPPKRLPLIIKSLHPRRQQPRHPPVRRLQHLPHLPPGPVPPECQAHHQQLTSARSR
jgi:hypothetical protein